MSNSDSNQAKSYTWYGVLLVCFIVAVAIFLPRAFRTEPAETERASESWAESAPESTPHESSSAPSQTGTDTGVTAP